MFTNNLPAGLDTEIGEKELEYQVGKTENRDCKSTGFINLRSYLFDEATKCFDNESEQEILDNIKKVMDGKTIISIAHGITSIQDFDNILVIDQGKIN